jgi:mannose-6-phosphate isomerase-like protein (cupin superfamily)
MDRRGKITRAIEAKTFVDGDEFIKQYFQTEKLTFGVSVLQPGKVGGLDPGHAVADEVFYCAAGHVLCYFPEDTIYYELFKGDALLIPPVTGHKLFNIGNDDAIVIWACAPHP